MEVMCAVSLLMMFIVLCASAMVPVARIMLRLRRTLEAQIIADSVLESVRAEVEEAREYIRIEPYAGGEGADLPCEGGAVEFVNNDGCIMRVATGGTEAAEAGRLLYRYCAAGTPETGTEYAVFPEGFYTGLYLGLRFSPVLEDGLLMYLKITAQLGKGVGNAGEGPVLRDVICTESVIADLRYATVLEDGVRVKVGLALNPSGTD